MGQNEWIGINEELEDQNGKEMSWWTKMYKFGDGGHRD